MHYFRNKTKFEKSYPTVNAIIIGSGVVFFWRGLWGILDLYLFPNNPKVSFLASLFVGITILYVTHRITKELD
jgi:hypothetical protein